MSGNLKDYNQELDDFWESLPKKEYTQAQLKNYLLDRLRNADKTGKTKPLINSLKSVQKETYEMVREMIKRNNKAHVKVQAKKQAQQPTKTYSVEVRVQIMEKPNTKEGKSIIYWKTKFITLEVKYPLVDGQLDQRDSNNVYDEIKDLFDLYNVEILNWQVKKLKEINNKKGFEKIQSKQKSIAYRFLEELNGQLPEQYYEDNNCVFRFIVNSLTGVRFFGKITIPLLKLQFDNLKIDYSNGVSVDSMIYWIKTYHPKTISLFAIDPCYNVFKTYVAERPEHTLMFVVNNSHVYPVLNEAIKKRVAQTKNLETGQVTWYVEGVSYKLLEKRHISKSSLDFGVEQHGDNNQYEDFLKGVNQNKNEVILFESSLEEVAKDVIKSVGYSVTAMKFRNSEIEAFQHPVTQQIIQYAPDYHLRQMVCNKLHELHPLYCFQFRNQSFNTIATSWSEVMYGKIPKSYHIKEDQQIIDEYHTGPLIQTLVPDFQFNENCKGFDIKKSYANAVINMQDNYPIFSICDSIEKYEGQEIDVGEYLLDAFVIPQLGGVSIPKSIYGHNLVKKLLEKGHMDKSKILYVKKASYSFSAAILSDFLKKIREVFPDDNTFKALSVCFIGGLGRRFQTTDQCFITDDWETVCASFVDHKKGHNNWTVQSLEDLHFVKVSEKKRLYGEHSQIFRQVVSQGIIQLLELIETVYVPDESKLIGYNTDAVFMYNPRIIDFRDYPQYKPEAWKPKRYKVQETSSFAINIPEMKWTEINETETDIKDLPLVCIGGGGCGKTTTLIACNTPDTHVLSSTNKACDNIRQKGVQKVNTFDSYFYQSDRISSKTKKVQIDEYSMMTHYWLKTIYKIWADRPELIIQMFGDKNQCKAVCSSGRFFDYLQKRAFHAICGGNLLVKQYIKESARYDNELHQVVTHLLNTGKMHPKLKKQCINPNLQSNIVYFNDNRDKINNRFAQGFYIGQKVIAETNKKAKGLYNSKFYYITEMVYKDVQNKKTKITERLLHRLRVSETPQGKPIHEKGFNAKYFRAAFAVTVFKYQGSTIDEQYNIYDTEAKIKGEDAMSQNELYTALTRGKKLSDIHIKFSDRTFEAAAEPETSTPIKSEKATMGYIYEMFNQKHNVYYIGQTKKYIKERFKSHKQDENDTMHKYDGKWTIKELTKIHFFDQKVLLNVEKLYTLKYQLEGHKVVNKTNLLREEVKLTTKVVAGKYDEKLLQKFKIQEAGSAFRIRYTEGGRQKEIKRRFDANNKEEKRKEISEIQSKLILSFD